MQRRIHLCEEEEGGEGNGHLCSVTGIELIEYVVKPKEVLFHFDEERGTLGSKIPRFTLR